MSFFDKHLNNDVIIAGIYVSEVAFILYTYVWNVVFTPFQRFPKIEITLLYLWDGDLLEEVTCNSYLIDVPSSFFKHFPIHYFSPEQ